MPSQSEQLVSYREACGCSIGLRRVKDQIALESQHLAHRFSQLADGHIFAASDVDDFRGIVAIQEKQAGISKVIDVEKFAPGGSCAPHYKGILAALHGLMHLANQRGKNVGAVKIEIVVRSVKVRWHARDEGFSIFARIGLAELDPCDLGEGIGLVRRLQRASEEGALGNGLRREFGVNAGAAKEKKLSGAKIRGSLDDVVLDCEILQQKLDGLFVIGSDAPTLAAASTTIAGRSFSKKARTPSGQEIELRARASQDLVESCPLQPAHNGASHHPSVARDID